MAYSDAAAVLRSDINALVEEAGRATEFYIAERVMPIWTVNEQNGQWPKFRLAKGELLNDDVSLRMPGSAYQRATRAYESDTYDCKDRGLEELVDDTYRNNVARFFDAEVAAARQVLRQIRLGLEVRVSAAIINASNFTATNPAVDYTEANIATINFPKDVMDAVDRLNAKGVVPNTIVLSGPLANRIKRSTIFQNFVRGNLPAGQPVIAVDSDIGRAFADLGITSVLIGRASKNSAKKGQAFTAASVWANTHIWVGAVESGDPMNGGAGRVVVWNKEGGIYVTETYREEQRRSNIVRVRHNTAEKVVDGTAGELITTNYS